MVKRIRILNLLAWLCASLFVNASYAADQADLSYDGLERVKASKIAAAYVHPEADFSAYKKIMLLDPHVAFKKNWKKAHRGVSNSHMDRMKRRTSDLFRHVFTDVMEESGYPVVNEAGDDVLLVRPAIIDLDVSAPDKQTAGRSYTFTTNAGSATLYVELFDSSSGAILARGLDRKHARSTSTFQLSSSVYNSSEGRKIFKKWAGILRDRLNEIQGR
jgi:hypothetical protein